MDERFHHDQQLDRIERLIRDGLADVNKKLGNMMKTANQIEQDQTSMKKKETEIMAAIDDLKQAVVDVKAAVTQAATDILAAVAIIQNPNSTDADVEAAAVALEGTATDLKTSTASLEAVLPKPPAA